MKKHATVWKKGFFWEPVSSASLWNSNSLHLFSHHSSQPAVSPLYSHFLFSFCHYLSSPPPPPPPPPPLFLLLRPLSISLALSPFLALHHLPSVSLSLPSTPFPFFSSFPVKKRSDWERHSVRIAGSRWRLSAPADSLCRSDLSPLH